MEYLSVFTVMLSALSCQQHLNVSCRIPADSCSYLFAVTFKLSSFSCPLLPVSSHLQNGSTQLSPAAAAAAAVVAAAAVNCQLPQFILSDRLKERQLRSRPAGTVLNLQSSLYIILPF